MVFCSWTKCQNVISNTVSIEKIPPQMCWMRTLLTEFSASRCPSQIPSNPFDERSWVLPETAASTCPWLTAGSNVQLSNSIHPRTFSHADHWGHGRQTLCPDAVAGPTGVPTGPTIAYKLPINMLSLLWLGNSESLRWNSAMVVACMAA